MPKRVFISYSHKQKDWVYSKLVPCLRAGGVIVDIDLERFEAGGALLEQMNKIQDAADVNFLILTSDYLNSQNCLYEMKRAISRDPRFLSKTIIPVIKEDCTLPEEISICNPIFVDLRNDKEIHPWDLLLAACGSDIGIEVPRWLDARDELVKFLLGSDSVNLLIKGNPKWRELITHVFRDYLKDFGIIDLYDGATYTRRGLVTEILKAANCITPVPDEPEDLVTLSNILKTLKKKIILAIEHFDLIISRSYGKDVNFFAALRHLIVDTNKLVLLAQSRKPFYTLLPQDHPLSPIVIKTVELIGKE